MKNYKKLYAFAFLFVALTSCVDNEEILLKENLVEFDASTYNANGLTKTYPVVRQLPPYGFAIQAASPLITRSSGVIQFRINVVGPQSASSREINYKVVPNETFTQVISSVSRVAQPAVISTHFTTSGKVTIPANSSFGILSVTIVDPGSALPNDLLIVLELEGNSELKPSFPDKQLGIWINRG